MIHQLKHTKCMSAWKLQLIEINCGDANVMSHLITFSINAQKKQKIAQCLTCALSRKIVVCVQIEHRWCHILFDWMTILTNYVPFMFFLYSRFETTDQNAPVYGWPATTDRIPLINQRKSMNGEIFRYACTVLTQHIQTPKYVTIVPEHSTCPRMQ